MMLDPTIPEDYRDVIAKLREYRKRIKLLGYTKGVRYEPGAKGCHLMRDGVIRANWNATGRGSGDGGATTSGRLTSSPNMQNWKFELRSMLIARPGHVFVDADFDQLELRLVASMAQCRAYLEILARAAVIEPNHPMHEGMCFIPVSLDFIEEFF